MGGGTSNLFYGTKGSQKEYQYTLFTDKAFAKHEEQVAASSESIASKGSHKTSYYQEISAATIIKKCHEYYDGKLSAKQFVDWLEYIISDPLCRLEDKLGRLIETTLQRFRQCIEGDPLALDKFTSLMHDFENRIYQLL